MSSPPEFQPSHYIQNLRNRPPTPNLNTCTTRPNPIKYDVTKVIYRETLY